MIRFNASARYVHAAGPMLFMLCLVAINYKRPGLYKQLVIEDGIVEWATVVVYVMAAVLGMGLCRRLLDTIGLGGALGSLVLSRLGVPAQVVDRLLPPPRLLLYFLPCSVFYLMAEIVSPYTTVRYVGTLGVRYGWKLNDPKGVLAFPAHVLDLLRDWLPMWTGMGGQKSPFWHHQEPVELLLALGFLFFVISCRRVKPS
jgi:hypothetical protein